MINQHFKKLLLYIFILSTIRTSIALANELTIVDSHYQAIPDAEVLIGFNENKTPNENVFYADKIGKVTIPKELLKDQPVTITAEGQLRATFSNLNDQRLIKLHKAESKNLLKVSGQTTNFENIKTDGKIDFALVHPAFTQSDLTQFDVESVISSEMDAIKILTETVSVPSNLTLPNQKENYFLPITINKPTFRISFKHEGDYRLMATHGQFPFSQVVNELRGGKSFYEVINHFTFLGSGQTDLALKESIAELNIPVNQTIYNEHVTVKGVSSEGDNVMFSLALSAKDGLYFPTDIKLVNPDETVELTTSNIAENSAVVSILMPRSEAKKIGGSKSTSIVTQTNNPDAPPAESNATTAEPSTNPNSEQGGLSFALHESANSTPKFLNLVPRPTMTENKITSTQPALMDGIDAVATHFIISEIEIESQSDQKVENKFKIWEATSPGWVNEITVPKSIVNLVPGKKYKCEVLFLGRQSGHNKSGDYFLDDITHFSRNSYYF
ncbi:MAG: hypothetical protein ABL927_10005 [Bdellovibrionales bacterium]